MKTAALLTVLFIVGLAPLVYATPIPRPDLPTDAEIVDTRGDNRVRFVQEEDWRKALLEQALTAGDTLKTDNRGRMDLLFVDGTQIKVHAQTTLLIKQVRKPSKPSGTILNLQIGEIWSRARSTPQSLKIGTPSATAAIRGTDWDIAVDDKGTSYLTVLKGSVDLTNDFGSVQVDAGEQAIAEIGKAPVKMFLVRPRDRVQWIVSYPLRLARLVSFRADRLTPLPEQVKTAEQTLISTPDDHSAALDLAGLYYEQRLHVECLRLTDAVLEDNPGNVRARLIKGLVLLDQGRVDEAQPLIESAHLNSIGFDRDRAAIGLAGIAVRMQQFGRAETIIEDLKSNSDSALAGLASASMMAYRGEFRDATILCDSYLQKYPDDERFLTLKAEFLQALDEPVQSFALIRQAIALNPGSSMAYTIFGRHHYLAGNSGEAENAYRHALALNPGNADARSELGRLLMERGYFEEAVAQMNAAVGDDVAESQYRSQRGMLMNWVEELGAARDDFLSATEINPADYKSFDGLGVIALKEGRTEDAIRYFQKASTLEPGFAEPHVFMAIAHYQLGEVDRAIEDLELAKNLDPNDPLPHMVAYIIYQDTYRPFASISEATRALELLPNLKSTNPIEKTNEAVSNLGSALLNLDLTEWATSYAEEAFDPFDASSYHFVALKHESNPMVYASGSTHGFLIDPLSIGSHSRYQDIVAKPHHELEVKGRLGSEDGATTRNYKLTQQGYLRKPLELRYLLDYDVTNNDGFRENSDLEDELFTFALGAKPDYRNGFLLYGAYAEKDYGEPVNDQAEHIPNDRNESTFKTLDAGYNHRFGRHNHLILNAHFSKTTFEFTNPDPYGTGLTDTQLSFVDFFGLQNAQTLLDGGVFDVTSEALVAGPWSYPVFATDSSGFLAAFAAEGNLGVSLIPSNLPDTLDPDNTIFSEGEREGQSYQVKHLFEPNDHHKASWGFEYSPVDFHVNSYFNEATFSDAAVLIDDYVYWAFGAETFMAAMPYLQAETTTSILNQDSTYYTAYVNDRWQLSERLLLDAGVYYEKFKNELNDFNKVHPRVGVAWKFHDNHILRVAYQQRFLESFEMTLAPVTTAGLFFEWIQLYPGAIITDYQAAIESKWSDRFFTSLGYEVREHDLPDLGFSIFPDKNRARIVNMAVNAILTDRLGAYLRYKYVDSKNLTDPYRGKRSPFVPEHSAAAGLVAVLPEHIKAVLSLNYADGQYDDDANSYRLPRQTTVDFLAQWEPMDKHLMASIEFLNLFDEHYMTERYLPAAGRSAFLTIEYRF